MAVGQRRVPFAPRRVAVEPLRHYVCHPGDGAGAGALHHPDACQRAHEVGAAGARAHRLPFHPHLHQHRHLHAFRQVDFPGGPRHLLPRVEHGLVGQRERGHEHPVSSLPAVFGHGVVRAEGLHLRLHLRLCLLLAAGELLPQPLHHQCGARHVVELPPGEMEVAQLHGDDLRVPAVGAEDAHRHLVEPGDEPLHLRPYIVFARLGERQVEVGGVVSVEESSDGLGELLLHLLQVALEEHGHSLLLLYADDDGPCPLLQLFQLPPLLVGEHGECLAVPFQPAVEQGGVPAVAVAERGGDGKVFGCHFDEAVGVFLGEGSAEHQFGEVIQLVLVLDEGHGDGEGRGLDGSRSLRAWRRRVFGHLHLGVEHEGGGPARHGGAEQVAGGGLPEGALHVGGVVLRHISQFVELPVYGDGVSAPCVVGLPLQVHLRGQLHVLHEAACVLCPFLHGVSGHLVSDSGDDESFC